ncbi:hypothetical protein [Burkholderia gladioli]|uniref:hypothetical protein n=1 Tax=Burkholderia gladioli TaxID=28095 RepID=UPI001641CA90|nr:hypothetical protein [Burkholderia gladioli]
MAKPLAGKRAFEAMGRRAATLRQPLNHHRMERLGWPVWARTAFTRGWMLQPSPGQQAKRTVQAFVEKSIRDGVSLRVTVDRFLDDMRRDDLF